ncbi:DNA polymerase III subunit gamma/tau [Vibrio sp. UCD-FRSSP16_10]|uniref:DNA polymerase III subunit gamma/tau n=1 Tax=unclassified Vibrio TaxID=2614977 RepID=UPI0007FE143C|nr:MULTISPECIES: DNA polymerase III subunit gamma/tau [unclassified Vibrio]OBT15893.1 DNA polymerase III subunit gamma/tau [Vibrio sp. UCD-FRSSP16_10]OBT17787.1 DNA polymerase III subunit gamma/tau [Vibrio sp. UCD-FRSSP16_30]
MSYLALARKWRPKQFKEVVGQEHVLTALENALDQNRLHHAYLLSGTRGVGKTTIGRLLAKGLNCETGITATPCGVCQSCIEIDQGRFVDLLEIDAASRTKVEDTRDLLDNVQYKPARGRFKVYLIDEVHMLSKHSFNALLKTLEEPPEYVKFLLATTDPQKLPVTILSRCLQFHLKPITVENIHQQLEHVLEQEGVSREDRALGMLAHAADGSMRDALSLADQAIALGNGSVVTTQVSAMLGTLDSEQALYLIDALIKRQASASLAALDQLAANGVSWNGLLQELAMQLHRIAMYQVLPATLDPSHLDTERVQHLAGEMSPQEVQLYYQIALKGRKELSMAPTERAGAEMTLLRMLAFSPKAESLANTISTHSVAPAASVQSLPVVDTTPAMERPSPVQQAKKVLEQPQRTTPVVDSSINRQPVIESPEHPSVSDLADSRSNSPAHVPESTGVSHTAAPNETVKSPLVGLRHQLRSKRQSKSSSQGDSAKKGEATQTKMTKKESVLQRVTQQHPPKAPSESVLQQKVDTSGQPYQWQASKPLQAEQKKPSLTPALLKKALEHEKTPDMVNKLLEESVTQDSWCALIAKLNTAKLVEQLALNSYYEEKEDAIVLHLRSSQKHLNSDKSRLELIEALTQVTGETRPLSVQIDEQGQTPLELRETLYQGKLEQAFQSLDNDEHIKFIEARFSAELDRESVRPI